MARQEFVAYLNSGDELYQEKTLEHIFLEVQDKCGFDIFYGDLVFVDDLGRVT